MAELMPDELPAGVDERAAGVAGVDRGGGLDRVGDDVARAAGLALRLSPGRTGSAAGPGWSSAAVVTGRLRALTMPVVTVPARPSGLPIAMTGSPTLRSLGVADRDRA